MTAKFYAATALPEYQADRALYDALLEANSADNRFMRLEKTWGDPTATVPVAPDSATTTG